MIRREMRLKSYWHFSEKIGGETPARDLAAETGGDRPQDSVRHL
ncbi:hypothetical protein [Candidatus Nitrospira neomarina]|uniref:Uncharacterized protein n=1 Tax=Candidatus Nitrospira neomarina TaxID=3020899 RepID=A0AA96GP53_9BACT|nr:hypothetical protein [Candidatus Nitrospira neomarina]WNM64015.1 hypothetical protein PQG83_09740 [Candidatus Nitrospira neomarina]